MKIFSFYSSWYDRHMNSKKLEKAGIDPWNLEGKKIPKNLRSPNMDYIITGIPEGSVYSATIAHIYHNGGCNNDYGDNWRIAFFDGVESDLLKTMAIVPFDYQDTLKEEKSLPELPNRIWYILFSIIFLGNDWDGYDHLKEILRKYNIDRVQRLDKIDI